MVYFKGRKLDWKWVIIALLIGMLLAQPSRVIHDLPSSPSAFIKIKPIKPLAQTSLQPVSEDQTVYIAPVIQTPVPQTGVTNCGSDPNLAYIYQHESGCRTDAIGPNGPCGLGQALPCSKLGCSLSDWDCQNAWFTAYALRTYGSTYNAMLFWQAHSWW